MKISYLAVVVVVFLMGCSPGKDVFTYYREGNREYVYRYVKSGKNVCIKNAEIDNNITLLTFSIVENDDKLCNLILQNNTFSLEFELSQGGYTALHAAAAHGKNSFLIKVLPLTKDINIPDGTTPLTPLGYALSTNNHRAMQLILSHKTVDVNYVNPRDPMKLTVSHIAGRRGDLYALKLLQKHGADFSQKNSDGDNVKDYVIKYLGNKEYVSGEKEEKLRNVVKFLSES